MLETVFHNLRRETARLLSIALKYSQIGMQLLDNLQVMGKGIEELFKNK